MKQRHDLTRARRFGLVFVCLAIGVNVPLCFNAPLVFHAGAQANKDRSGSTSKSRAPAKKPIVPKSLDPCAVDKADANLTLGPGVPGVQATSDGVKYYSGDDYPNKAHCGLFLVDITVPSNSSAPGFLPSFSIESGAVDLKKANGENMNKGTNYAGGFAVPNYNGCFGYHQETRIFARNFNANEFTLLSSVTARGEIDETTPYDPTKKCFLRPDPGQGALSYGLPFGAQPSKSGTKVYRVAVKVSLGSISNWGGANLQQVRVKASHDGDIK
ncbi:MAG TPA: hypothetical protein VGJ55_04195 [Pyrinomonadaceae bacterium]|jgi:hypothetical protein